MCESEARAGAVRRVCSTEEESAGGFWPDAVYGREFLLALPMLPITRLRLALMKASGSTHPATLRDVISQDPNALLGVFALAQIDPGLGAADSLESALAKVSAEPLLSLLVSAGNQLPGDLSGYLLFAQHAACIATACQEVAAALSLDLDLSFLVGLLHEVDLPTLYLGQATACIGENGGEIEQGESPCYLPAQLTQALTELYGELPSSVWAAVLQAAHDLCDRRV